ncbi:MAG: MotA/TolQ/ExbB proton channel family protein [Calothrix sp. C42_A2020_038]|nr:MotA/TolQ/ExbB proton channel family protein [Calothrix sp. C42_A2020_038]
MDIVAEFRRGGPAMYPLLALSILALSVIFERLWFWLRMLNREGLIVERVLEAARENWGLARDIAQRATDQPIGRFLYAPLSLSKNDPESFRLALEATAEDELTGMRRGEKLLEAVIALAPLLGLFGTVWGLIQSLRAIKIGDLGTEATAGVTTGIGESLISTATGMVVAITSLVFYRLFQAFIFNQVQVFRKAGNELELLYRQSPPTDINVVDSEAPTVLAPETKNSGVSSPRRRGKNKFGEPYEAPAESKPIDSENI